MNWIKQGKDTPLGEQPQGSVPQMGQTLDQWLQPLTVGIVTKTIKNFQSVETMVQYTFRGVWQVFTARQLMLKPEGQRAWSWYMIHTQTDLVLKVDDVFEYKGKQYRVMLKKNYSLYGYFEYDVVQDWENSGPEVVEP